MINTAPEILKITEVTSGFELDLYVPENFYLFQGHFPQAPILPGVVQLDWAIQFAAKQFGWHIAQVADIEVLKFKVIIKPKQNITLSLKQLSDQKFSFQFESDAGQHSSGRIVVNLP